MDSDVLVTDVRDAYRFEIGGKMTPLVRVTYYIKRFGPFTDEWEKETYTRDKFDAKVADRKLHLPI